MATDVYARVVNFVVPAAGGSYDILGSLGDKTPKAIMLIGTYHVGTDGVEDAHALMGVGFSDGTRSKASMIRILDNQATSSSNRSSQGNVCFWTMSSGGVTDIQITFSSFITNGARVSISNGGGTTPNLTAVFFFGDDLSAYVNSTGTLGTGSNTKTINTVGFQGDVGFFVGGYSELFDNLDFTYGNAHLNFGIASRAAGTQKCLSVSDDSGIAAGGTPVARLNSTAAIEAIDEATGAVIYTGTVGNWTSSGFDIVVAGDSGASEIGYLILKLGDMDNVNFVLTTPTATGSSTITDPAFFPQFAMVIGSNLEAVNTSAVDTQLAGGLSVSCFDIAGTTASHVIRNSSVADPTDTASVFTETALQTGTGLSTAGIVATNTDFNNNGWVYNYSAVQASAKVLLAFALELGDSIPSPVGFTFGDFTDDSFQDWAIDGAAGADFTSYLYTYFQATEDEMYYMQAPYIYVYLENQDPNTAADPTLTESLLFRGAWDWANASESARWSREEQVYNYRQNNLVAIARKKVRGKGRVLQLRFTSEPGKDFKLLGWGVVVGKNTDP